VTATFVLRQTPRVNRLMHTFVVASVALCYLSPDLGKSVPDQTTSKILSRRRWRKTCAQKH